MKMLTSKFSSGRVAGPTVAHSIGVAVIKAVGVPLKKANETGAAACISHFAHFSIIIIARGFYLFSFEKQSYMGYRCWFADFLVIFRSSLSGHQRNISHAQEKCRHAWKKLRASIVAL